MLYHSVVEGWLIMIKDDGQPVVAPPDGVDIADCPTAVITAMLEAKTKIDTKELQLLVKSLASTTDTEHSYDEVLPLLFKGVRSGEITQFDFELYLKLLLNGAHNRGG